jgi:hypothetical protein
MKHYIKFETWNEEGEQEENICEEVSKEDYENLKRIIL